MSHFDLHDLSDDQFNPYAPPKAEIHRVIERPRPRLAIEPFSMDAVWRMTWSIYKARMGQVIGYVLGSVFLSNAITVVAQMILEERGVFGDPDELTAGRAIFTLAGLIFGLWIQAGLTLALLKIAHGQETSFGDVFRGGRYVLSFIWGAILVGVAVGGAYLVALLTTLLGIFAFGHAPSLRVLMIGVGVVVGVVVGLYILIRLYLYQYAIVDREDGGLDGVRFSYQITAGHVLQMIGLALFSCVLMILGLLALFIGLLFTAPLVILMMTCTYVLLANEARALPEKPSYLHEEDVGTEDANYPDL